MKKILTFTLVFVFALALVFALGCNKKEEPASTEGGMEGMEQSTPAASDTMMAAPDTTMGGAGGMGGGH